MRRPLLLLVLALGLVGLVPTVPASGASADATSDPAGVWPLDPEPEVVAGFDPPADRYGAGHRGVDLAGAAGQAVRTALAGEVTFAGRLAGKGVVTVTHGDTRTTYEPVTASVTVGDAVGAGDVIGTLEPFASHCAPRTCLHWGWLRGEEYLDPLRLVGGGPVRLVPLEGLPAGVARSHPYAAWSPLATADTPGAALLRALDAVRRTWR